MLKNDRIEWIGTAINPFIYKPKKTNVCIHEQKALNKYGFLLLFSGSINFTAPTRMKNHEF